MTINATSLYNKDYETVNYHEGEEIIKVRAADHEEGFGLLIKNADASADATVTIKGSNSILSVGDMVINAEKGKETLINLKNTGRYKNVSGEDAGYIVIEISGVPVENISVFAFEL